MNLLNQTPALFGPWEIDDKIKALESGEDDGWHYIARRLKDSKSLYKIAVYDSDNNFVGWM